MSVGKDGNSQAKESAGAYDFLYCRHPAESWAWAGVQLNAIHCWVVAKGPHFPTVLPFYEASVWFALHMVGNKFDLKHQAG